MTVKYVLGQLVEVLSIHCCHIGTVYYNSTIMLYTSCVSVYTVHHYIIVINYAYMTLYIHWRVGKYSTAD